MNQIHNHQQFSCNSTDHDLLSGVLTKRIDHSKFVVENDPIETIKPLPFIKVSPIISRPKFTVRFNGLLEIDLGFNSVFILLVPINLL